MARPRRAGTRSLVLAGRSGEMSDQELRSVLQQVIDDIDRGRLRPQRGRALRNLAAASALAAGLALGGCGRPVSGLPDRDAGQDARPDSGPVDAYGIPLADAGLDARPDSGPVDAYGVPVADAGLDSGVNEDSGVDPFDGGVFLYGAPPMPREDER